MIALLWTALNVLLLIMFLYAWGRVVQVLRREIGLGFALLFMLGLLSFGGKDSNSGEARNLLASEKSNQQLGNWQTTQHIPINSHNQLSVRIEALHTDSTTHPLSLYASVSGLLVGHTWKSLGGFVTTKSQKLYYQIHMVHEWKLLGFSLYTTVEEYSGSSLLANAR